MLRGLIWVVLFAFVFSARAGQLPLTAKEISLMLRAGYSSDAVMQELAKRRYAGTFDPDQEGVILKAGASPDLLKALEQGTYAVSAQEAERVQEALASAANRKAAEAERSRNLDTLYQSQLVRERSVKSARLSGP